MKWQHMRKKREVINAYNSGLSCLWLVMVIAKGKNKIPNSEPRELFSSGSVIASCATPLCAHHIDYDFGLWEGALEGGRRSGSGHDSRHTEKGGSLSRFSPALDPCTIIPRVLSHVTEWTKKVVRRASTVSPRSSLVPVSHS